MKILTHIYNAIFNEHYTIDEKVTGLFIGTLTSFSLASIWSEALHAMASTITAVLSSVAVTIAVRYTKKWLNKN